MRLLDTDVMVDLLREYQPAVKWLASLGEQEAPGLPGFVVMELIEGEKIRNKADLLVLRRRLRMFKLYWPGAAECDKALTELFAHYLGDGLRPFDALIGACALTHNAVLCTFNTRHFDLIAGLRTEQPYGR